MFLVKAALRMLRQILSVEIIARWPWQLVAFRQNDLLQSGGGVCAMGHMLN